jgi:hypothetical protein
MFGLSRWLTVAIVALLLLAATSLAHADGTPTPQATHLHGEDTGSARLDAGDAAVRIVSPADGATLTETSVIVRVETLNWPLSEGKHWHLYVNGQAQGMSQGSNPALLARDLLVGANTLEAVLSNEQHQELNATHRIIVTVQSLNAGGASNNEAVLLIAVLIGALIVIGGGALLLLRKT